MRVAVMRIHPAPYREPVLHKLGEDGRFEVDAFSIVGEDGGHSGMALGIDDRPLAGVRCMSAITGITGVRLAVRLLKRFVFSRRYSYVVWPAYFPWWLTAPILADAFLGRRYAVSLDTVRDSGGAICRWIKRFIFRRAAFLWVPGAASCRYLHDMYGIPQDRIASGLYLPEPLRMDDVSRDGPQTTFLMVANNVPNRSMDVMAEGFRKFAVGRDDVRLILCGKDVDSLAGGGVEAVEGGCTWQTLNGMYAKADVYVHTGEEQFSTALLLGAMAGVPLLAGAEVGVCADLFEGPGACPGLLVSNWRSAERWCAAFEEMLKRRDSWPEMGKAARACASKFDVADVAKNIGDMFVRLDAGGRDK